jgi:hypothetical protein
MGLNRLLIFEVLIWLRQLEKENSWLYLAVLIAVGEE